MSVSSASSRTSASTSPRAGAASADSVGGFEGRDAGLVPAERQKHILVRELREGHFCAWIGVGPTRIAAYGRTAPTARLRLLMALDRDRRVAR